MPTPLLRILDTLVGPEQGRAFWFKLGNRRSLVLKALRRNSGVRQLVQRSRRYLQRAGNAF